MEQAADIATRAKKDIAGFDKFQDWLDLYYGRHYPDTMPSYRPPVVANELRTLILSEASDLSDAGLRIYVMKDPTGQGRDEQVERALRTVWVREQIDLKLVEAIVWYMISGGGFLRVSWDPDAYYGYGDVAVEALDPRVVLPDPDAPDDRRWLFVGLESVLDMAEIKRLFPNTAWKAKPDDEYSVKEGRSGYNTTPAGASHAPAGLSPSYPYAGPLADTSSLTSHYPGYKKARARVLSFYVKDDAIETAMEPLTGPDGQPLLDENGNQQFQEVRRLKYQGGRYMVGAGGAILADGSNPNPGGDFGILRVVLEPTLGRFWGTGFAQQTGELQLAADKLLSSVVENAVRLNNGIVVAKGNTGIDWETFASIPGQIVQLGRDGDFDIKYPNPMPADMVQAPWRLLDMQRRILGFPDPRTGQGGRGNTSPELTETEITQSQGMTRLRAKFLYHVVQRLAEMIFARMASGYSVERVIPAVEGETFAPVVWKPIERPERYSIYVDPASFQVMSRSMLRRLSLALYRMNLIDRRAALEVLGWPDWEKVSDRVDKAEQLSAMAKLESKRKK
jgi:hypothetical protein